MPRLALLGFLAWFLATITFHQAAIWLMLRVLPFPFAPWNMAPNDYGMPRVVALSVWAGVWGIGLCLLLRRGALWQAAVLGSVIPSVWGWTVIAGMRGAPLFANGNLRLILMVLFVNAVWGLATLWLFRLMQGSRPHPAM